MAVRADQDGMTQDGTRYCLQAGEGPVVVLIHGLGLDRHMWRHQVEALSARYTVLTYDLLGSGESASPPAAPNLSMFSRQLNSLLDALGLANVAVAGFSLGGMIARRFAMDFGEKLWALAILNSAYARDDQARAAIQARVDQARIDGPSATVEAALERWFTADFREANPHVMEWVRRTILANDPSVYPQLYQVLVDGVDELSQPDPPIACPTLVMTAEEDFGNSAEMARAIAAEIPKAETVILPGLRHMAMVEAPDMFNAALIGFLDRIAGGAEGWR